MFVKMIFAGGQKGEPMARYIDADILRELIDGGYDIDFSEIPETKKALLNMIDYQDTAQPEPHWIPCSERLPKIGQEVLVWMHYIDDNHNNDFWFYSFGFCGGVTWHTIHELNASIIEVAAWMPLPEPYKGE